MKMTAFILLVACLQVSAIGKAQGISISEKNAPLEKIFKSIEKQTGYTFFYENKILLKAKKVDITVSNAGLAQVLDLCFKNQPIQYNIVDKTVVVTEKETFSGLNNGNLPNAIAPPIDVHGQVVNDKGEPLEGVTVAIKGSKNATATDANGFFTLKSVDGEATLVFSGINVVTQEIKLGGRDNLATIQLKTKVTQGEEVTVEVNTGYQKLPKDRSTGSFENIDNKLINRTVSSDILSRLQYVTSGLLYTNQYFNIRGTNTIFAKNTPLVVLDNFEYNGDIKNINPNDVESVTVLKDAAATSIWGAKAGNGVIVITTKNGKYNQPTQVSLNVNLTTTAKPDLFSLPLMNSSDYIYTEKFLFNNGYYNNYIQFARFLSYPLLSPVVIALNNAKTGTITQNDADAEITKLGAVDVRNDYLKYLYRISAVQQYSINLRGGSETQKFYLSVGDDNNLSNVVGNNNNRITVDANNTYSLINHKLDINTRIIYTQTKQYNNGSTGSGVPYPYAQLTDANGNPAALPKYNVNFLDTVGQGRFLDWSYRPLDEIKNANNTVSGQDYQAYLGIKYRFTKNFDADIHYLYAKGMLDTKNIYSLQTFFTRDLINQYTQFDPSGTLINPIPIGGILDMRNSSYTSKNIRGQLNYSNTWNFKHQLDAIAGGEINDLNTEGSTDRFYGYDDEHATSIPVDYTSTFRNVVSRRNRTIPNIQTLTGLTSRYASYYGNVAYTYYGKYTLSGSVRKNASNLFGVNENQKGIPLWSSGAAWELSRENFYSVKWLPYLRLRATYGYSGNIDQSVTAFLVSRTTGLDRYQLLQSTIQTPPNPELRWEKDGMLNIGLDYSIKKGRIRGSIEYYSKKGTDLLGFEPLALSSGIATVTNNNTIKKNSADMKGSGFDIVLNSNNITGKFEWKTQFLFSATRDHVTDYKVKNGTASDFALGINPVVGKPVHALYAYHFGGLDSAGNPLGYLNGKQSTDYSSIINAVNDPSTITYEGSQQPTVFGSLINTFSYKNISLSVNIVYKFGYYFLRPSVDYTTLFRGVIGNKDFEKRWQNPGDEKITNVPSMVYPDNPQRDIFYQYSSALVEKGDQIRLQDIQISYDLNKSQFNALPFNSIRVYSFISNAGKILWRANKDRLDPDYAYAGTVAPRPSLALGLNVNF